MKRLTVLIAAVVMGGSLFGVEDYGPVDGKARNVSLVQLIVQPEKYLGTAVRVHGVLRWEFEGCYLFLSRESLESYDTASAIAVARSKISGAPTDAQLKECSDALVMVEGLIREKSFIYYLEITRVQVRDAKRSKERQRESNQSPEATPGQRPPAAPSPSSGAPQL